MSEKDFYPAGAYNDPSAPYNEPVIPATSFDIDVTVTLKKSVSVTTEDYIPEYDDETGHTDANTENTNWKDAFEQEHYSLPQLLDKLKVYLRHDISMSVGCTQRVRSLQLMLEDCENWEVIEEEYG